MKLYLNAGFGEPLGVESLNWIRDHGFRGIRQEVLRGDDARPLLQEIRDADLDALVLVGGGFMDRLSFEHAVELARHVAIVADEIGLVPANRVAIEIGNEPDNSRAVYKSNPAEFARLVRESATAIWDAVPDAVVISGGVMNTHRAGLDYLDRAAGAGFLDGVQIGYHSYHTTTPPETPHTGFRSRDEEFERLLGIAAGRPMWCTEVGWHTFPSEVRFGFLNLMRRRVQFTDDQVADFTEDELRLHRDAGAVGAAVFQLNDGPEARSFEDRFGVRRFDGTEKPVAVRIRERAADFA